ncbi:FliM/FliN family flagellar motor switch protein [Anaplasmataceae bacterium AB001_6]|nr:FliM/FliN family flagellar motor switch protein [Anaplasmataceae bacterium AB001_6]
MVSKTKKDILVDDLVDSNSRVMEKVKVLMTAVIGSKRISLGDLVAIRGGDVISMGNITDFVDIYANELLIAKGKLIEEEEKISIEIVEIIENY